MRVSFLKCMAILVLLGMMMTHSRPAEAHDVPHVSKPTYHASYSGSTVPAASRIEASASAAVAPVSGHHEDCCLCCCPMSTACCSMAAALNHYALDFALLPASFEFHAGTDALPQGPPYMLLRPPKFSA